MTPRQTFWTLMAMAKVKNVEPNAAMADAITPSKPGLPTRAIAPGPAATDLSR